MGTYSDVVYGLTAAGAFGCADFLARHVTHRVGFFTTMFILQLIGALIVVPFAWMFERSLWQAGDPWLFVIGLGVLNLVAGLALYRAFEYGVLSVVAPVVSMSPAVTATLALVILREQPSSRVLAGMVLAILGTVWLSRSTALVSGPPPKHAASGLVSAAAAVLGLGLMSFGAKFAANTVGPMSTIVALRLVGVVIAAIATGVTPARLQGLPRKHWPAALVMVVLDTTAFVAYVTGIGAGSVAVVSTLSGLFSAVTVGLAAVLLKERLYPVAYVAICVMLAGVVLIIAG
jgi:drug/metabolite transporter (DMT)-like permease